MKKLMIELHLPKDFTQDEIINLTSALKEEKLPRLTIQNVKAESPKSNTLSIDEYLQLIKVGGESAVIGFGYLALKAIIPILEKKLDLSKLKIRIKDDEFEVEGKSDVVEKLYADYIETKKSNNNNNE